MDFTLPRLWHLGESGRRGRIWRFAPAIALVVGTLSGDARAANEEALADRRLPANTPFVVATDNLAAAGAAWQATQLGRLFCGESFAPMRQAAAARGVATPLYLRPCFGFDWGDLSLHTGPAALAIVPVGGGNVGVAWVFPTSRQSADKLLASGDAFFLASGYQKTSETLGEAELTSFKPPAKDRRLGHPTYVVAKSVVVAANNRDAALIIWRQRDRQRKDSLAALKDSGDLAADWSTSASGPSLRWWLRPLELWASLRGGTRPTSQPDWLAIAHRQGGESIRAVGGEITFPTTGSTDLDLRCRVLVSQPLAKAAKLLDFSAGSPPALPKWLDGNVSSLSLWGADIPNATTAFGHLYDELTEPGPKGEGVFEEMLAGLRDDPEGPQVDLARDLFSHLGPGVLQATDCRQPGADGKNASRRVMFVLQCRYHDRVAKTLSRFYLGDNDVQRRTIDNATLWTIGEGRSLLFEGSNQSFAEVRAILVTDKTLVLATDPEMLTSRLSSSTNSSLAQSAAYQAVSKWWQTSGNHGARDAGFVQLAFWLEPPYDAVRARAPLSDWSATMLQFVFTGSLQPSSGFPVEKLPAFATIASLLPPVGTLRENGEGGWSVRVSVLRGLLKTQ